MIVYVYQSSNIFGGKSEIRLQWFGASEKLYIATKSIAIFWQLYLERSSGHFS